MSSESSKGFVFHVGKLTDTQIGCAVYQVEGEVHPRVYFSSVRLIDDLRLWISRSVQTLGLNGRDSYEQKAEQYETMMNCYRAAAVAQKQIDQLVESGVLSAERSALDRWSSDSSAKSIRVPVEIENASQDDQTPLRRRGTTPFSVAVPNLRSPDAAEALSPDLLEEVGGGGGASHPSSARHASSGTHPAFGLPQGPSET